MSDGYRWGADPHIVCIGDCGVDRFRGREDRTGGCALNVAVSMQYLVGAGASVGIVSALGDDHYGQRLGERIGNDFPRSVVSVMSGQTPVQKIDLRSDGERIFSGYLPGVLSEWQPDAAQLEVAASADLITIPLFQQFCQPFSVFMQSRFAGIVAVDFMDMTDFRPDDPLVARAIEKMTVGFFGVNASPDAIEQVRRLSAASEKYFVVTLGAAGSLVMQAGHQIARAPAGPVAKVHNTTGAGDSFSAAFLLSWLQDSNPQAALEKGSAHAAKIVSGAFEASEPI